MKPAVERTAVTTEVANLKVPTIPSEPSEHDTHRFEALLAYLKRSRGFDFTGYKRASLMRRVERQMLAAGVTGFDEYVDFLEVHPEEFARLFNMILINVTGFFRDPAAWEYLGQEALPQIIASRRKDEPIRLWCAGCASGEEPYSLAMLLVEALGFDTLRERVKIYATDIDDDALATARQASYTAREVSGIAPALLEKYFESSNGRYIFHKELRRAVIFGRHDLLKDAPISRIDLLTCRNTMMYFNAETQEQVLNRLHFALTDQGYLFLGKAEMLFTHGSLFTPLDLKRRIFTKVARRSPRDAFLDAPRQRQDLEPPEESIQSKVRELVLEDGPIPQVVIDSNGTLCFANDRAQAIFGLSPLSMGRMLQDLEISYRPVELRSRIEQAIAEKRTIEVKDARFHPIGARTPVYLDVQIAPLVDDNGLTLGTVVTFTDMTRYRDLQQSLEESNRALETAYEELQSTNEELETTNEELQSTVEELETTNEELQSTNEELETMNEELQATNEELQTINDEMQLRGAELNNANSFLGSILASLHGSVIVLDSELRIEIWNARAEETWGLRAEEVRGKSLLNLDFGLPAGDLKAPIRACLAGASEDETVIVDAVNRRGKAIRCTVACVPLHDSSAEMVGVILLVEEIQGASASV
jgi:two-component system CheB/CheR fusion protein